MENDGTFENMLAMPSAIGPCLESLMNASLLLLTLESMGAGGRECQGYIALHYGVYISRYRIEVADRCVARAV